MITLYGHGYIGNAIAKRLTEKSDKFYWYHHTEQLGGILAQTIVNAAGYTGTPNVDACEDHKEECIEGNILWPMKLQQYASYLPIVHITSGCVYTGYKEGGWTEEDEPNFGFENGSFYSGTKVVEQKVIRLSHSWILRIRMPFGKEDHPRNLLTKLRKYPKLVDTENSLSCIEDVVDVVLAFARYSPPYGIYNVCNPGSITTRRIAYLMGLEKEWFKTPEEFRATVKAPRSTCVLNTDKLTSIFPMRTVEEALKECINGNV